MAQNGEENDGKETSREERGTGQGGAQLTWSNSDPERGRILSMQEELKLNWKTTEIRWFKEFIITIIRGLKFKEICNNLVDTNKLHIHLFKY